MTAAYGSLPFSEALDYLRAKLDLPTEKWDDLLGAAHDRAFVVAGATRADLLADLHAAVAKAREQGATMADFRKDFERIVAERGWTGWTGEDSEAGRAWRARVIYETNLQTGYAAGRYRQLQAVAETRPYWRYRHNDAVVHPRPEHLAWDGKVLKHDDPWWSDHYPPNGWGCRCFVESLAERDLKRLGLEPTTGDDMPYSGTVEQVIPRTGEVIELPEGVDRGWDYAPGKSSIEHDLAVFSDKMARQERKIAVAAVGELVGSPVFARWLADPRGAFPLAVLAESDAAAIGAQTSLAQLSAETAVKQRAHHPELTAGEYARAQQCMALGERIQDGPLSLIYLLDEAGYVTVVKATKTGQAVFVTSFRRLSADAAKRDSEIRRLRGKKI